MSEHPERVDEQQQVPDESQQDDSSAGTSDPAPAEQGIPLPPEDSELNEGA